MAVYTVTTSNWNSAAFWSGIDEGVSGQTLDFSALPASFSISFDLVTNTFTISDGSESFTIGDAASSGPVDASLGGTTYWDYFDRLDLGAGDDVAYGGDGDDRISAGDGYDSIYGGDGSDSLDGGAGNDLIDGGADADTITLSDPFGYDTIIGGEGVTTGSDFDTLDMSGTGVGIEITFSGGEAGWATDGGGTATFSQIEALKLTDQDDTADGTASDAAMTVDALGGADSIVGSTAGDTIRGGDGNDTIRGAAGDDEIVGGAGDDNLYGNEGGDTIIAGDGNDSAYGEFGDDYIEGGAGDDHLEGNEGADTVYGGDGNDWIRGSYGNDEIWGGAGDDYLWGGYNDDTFHIENGFGNDTIDAEAVDEINGDTLDLSLVTDDLTIDLSGSNPEAGTFSDGISTASFDDIENIVLGGGRDTIRLADLGGADRVFAFDMADSGDGTTKDQLDVSGLTSDGGTTPVNSGDVTVTDDGGGNAVLSFPGGESITLTGVAPGALGSAAALESIGIPAPGAGGTDHIVEGTAGADLIDGAYTGDAQGDMIDNADAADGSDDDYVLAGDGNDTVRALDGDDTVYGEAGDDDIEGSFGDDYLSGGTGDDLLGGGDGNDTLTGGAGKDTLQTGGGRDVIVLADGSGADTVSDFDMADPGDGTTNDRLDVSGLTSDGGTTPVTVNDVIVSDTAGDGTGDAILNFPGGESITLAGVSVGDVSTPAQLAAMGIPGAGGDYIVDGTGGDDLINLDYTGDPQGDRIDNGDAADGSDDDYVLAGAGNDSIDAGAGDDTVLGEAGDDEFFLDGALDNDSIVGGDSGETLGDRINFSAIADDITVNFTAPGAGTISDGAHSTTFSGIERFQMGTGNDSVIGSDGAESIIGNYGDDTILGGGGDDTIYSGFDDDSVSGGAGDDVLWTSGGADTVAGGTGNDQIDLGAGDGEADLVILADGDGTDVISGFEAPTDNGDGTWSGNDQLDVSALTDASGNPVSAEDVAVSDSNGDGTGNAILSFPDGTSIELVGVAVSAVQSLDQLVAIGIPASGGDFIVEGTGGSDLIDAGYAGDPEGDRIDNHDHSDGSDDDEIRAGDGDDTVLAGDGDDTVSGGRGDDRIDGGAGDDLFVFADGDGADSVSGGETGETAGDTLDFGAVTGDMDIAFSGDEAGDAAYGADSVHFAGIERLILGGGNDSADASVAGTAVAIHAGAGDDTLLGGLGNDTLAGDAGNDSLTGGAGADALYGGAGDDTIVAGEGDRADGGDGDDLFLIADYGEAGAGDATIQGGEGGETLGDTLDFQGFARWKDVTYSNSDPGAGGGLSGQATLADGSVVTFSEIENVIICFTAGTRIATAQGAREVQELKPGDLVATRDHGVQPVRWVGQRKVPALGNLAPVRFAAGSIGNARDLLVSPQHRMLLQGPRAALFFGHREVLASAKHLVNGGSVAPMPGGEVTYVHILFDRHEIVYAEGAASESFFPGDTGLDAVELAAREELFTIFPELRSSAGGFTETARFCLRAHESRLLQPE